MLSKSMLLTPTERLEELNELLASRNLTGKWNEENLHLWRMTSTPCPTGAEKCWFAPNGKGFASCELVADYLSTLPNGGSKAAFEQDAPAVDWEGLWVEVDLDLTGQHWSAGKILEQGTDLHCKIEFDKDSIKWLDLSQARVRWCRKPKKIKTRLLKEETHILLNTLLLDTCRSFQRVFDNAPPSAMATHHRVMDMLEMCHALLVELTKDEEDDLACLESREEIVERIFPTAQRRFRLEFAFSHLGDAQQEVITHVQFVNESTKQTHSLEDMTEQFSGTFLPKECIHGSWLYYKVYDLILAIQRVYST